MKKVFESIVYYDKRLFCQLTVTIQIIVAVTVLYVWTFIQISQVRLEVTSSTLKLELENDFKAAKFFRQIMSKYSTSSKMIQLQLYQSSLSQEKNIQKLNNALYSPGLHESDPATSCATILLLAPSFSSGYYWVKSSNGSAVRMYCEMNLRTCGKITGGWTRVAGLNITEDLTPCPHGLLLQNYTINKTCVTNANLKGCSSVTFFTVPYSKICGRIQAYQYGATNAFAQGSANIEAYYVDGISLTHGSPRQHIWTFAAALDEVGTNPASNCPCNKGSGSTTVPEHVGNDYFCDTGSVERHQGSVFYDNPLWDGEGCSAGSTCCSFNNPPWFYKKLLQPTTDDNIEMRVCKNNDHSNIAIDLIDIYVQ